MGAAPGGKPENKAAGDAAAWIFNIVTSVGIIMVNRALMATHGFGFVTTLPGIHFATTALATLILKSLGYLEPSYLPLPELLKYVAFANVSVIGMNASLMWNSVGFYQISKLSMVPVLCMLEVLFDSVRYSRGTKLSIMVVLVGVAICTVTDVTVNAKGLVAAAVAVCSTTFRQHYIQHLQKKYSLSAFNLLSHTAPAQAASLLLLGPFVDLWLTKNRVDTFHYNNVVTFFIALSCVIAIGTNLSQFICIGRFTAVSFQVLGHMKTILVLTLGFILFGREDLNVHVTFGMLQAIAGMIWYKYASSRPGGKECQGYREPVEEDIELAFNHHSWNLMRTERKALEILCTRRPLVPSGFGGLLYISPSFIEQSTVMQLHPAAIEDRCESRKNMEADRFVCTANIVEVAPLRWSGPSFGLSVISQH